jgi:hypothetical protein
MVRQVGHALLLWSLICNCAAAALEDAEINLGRSIFEKGIGRDGREIRAILHGGVAMKGASIACAGCHGQDARGSAEAFVQAPDIRWANLSKHYTARRAGIAGVPYDRTNFANALRSGFTPGGNRLDPVMPRFSLAEDEVESLIAYLSVINGLVIERESRVVVLGLLPMPGRNSAADKLAWRMQNCPASVSRSRIAAIDILYFRNPEDAIAQVDKRVQDRSNIIILAPYLLGWEAQYIKASARWTVHTVLPFSFLDPPPKEENKWYYRFPGLQTQISALLRHARDNGRSRLIIVQDPDDELSMELAVFSRETALQYQFQIVTSPEDRETESMQLAKLWLTPLMDDVDAKTNKAGDLILVPALFHGSEKGNELMHKLPGVQWRIAYPYVPQRKNKQSWRKPLDVWADAACEFLTLLGEDTTAARIFSQILRWEEDLFLLPQPSEKAILDRVYIDEIRPH